MKKLYIINFINHYLFISNYNIIQLLIYSYYILIYYHYYYSIHLSLYYYLYYYYYYYYYLYSIIIIILFLSMIHMSSYAYYSVVIKNPLSTSSITPMLSQTNHQLYSLSLTHYLISSYYLINTYLPISLYLHIQYLLLYLI